MIDEDDTQTADLLRTVTTELESGRVVTVAGFGTGTVAELEYFIAGIIDERKAILDTLRKEAHSATTNAALALYDAVSLAVNTAMNDLVVEVEEQADEIRALRADIDPEGFRDVPDIDAIWAEISDRVDEAAAEAARDVIRNEMVASVDLI
jgi:hypothetical protein